MVVEVVAGATLLMLSRVAMAVTICCTWDAVKPTELDTEPRTFSTSVIIAPSGGSTAPMMGAAFFRPS